jgi:hypothetical protein
MCLSLVRCSLGYVNLVFRLVAARTFVMEGREPLALLPACPSVGGDASVRAFVRRLKGYDEA